MAGTTNIGDIRDDISRISDLPENLDNISSAAQVRLLFESDDIDKRRVQVLFYDPAEPLCVNKVDALAATLSPEADTGTENVPAEEDEPDLPRRNNTSQSGLKGRFNASSTKKKPENTSTTQTRKCTTRRALFTSEQTAEIMALFGDCKRRKMFSGATDKDMSKVWQEVSSTMNSRHPNLECTPDSIHTEYRNEKHRYRLFKTLTSKSGVTIVDGVCSVGDDAWEAFVRVHKPASQSIEWLRKVPLGDLGVY